jgi:class 3 adenylate cyclase/tetratricopeptide (TPR) repeat protein
VRHGDFWVVEELPTSESQALISNLGQRPALSEKVVSRIRSFIPPSVYEQVSAGHEAFVGQHRRVVSLFVSFAGLDYDRGPEVGDKAQRYFSSMQSLIRKYGGRLNGLITGDKGNLLHVIFGAPIAHEDNEMRAVRCALDMQSTVARDALRFIGEQSIGLASGYVFAGNVGSARRRAYTVMGDVVNLSARLMQAAKPGQILFERQTLRGLEDTVDCEPLGTIQVKGKADPVPVWEAIACSLEGPRWNYGSSGINRDEIPFVGRLKALALGERLLSRVFAGEGQILEINGEAGVGKSRLLAELLKRADARGLGSVGGSCLSFGARTPYLPWVTLFRGFFGLREKLSADAKLDHLASRMVELSPDLEPWIPLMGQFLDLSVEETPLIASLNGEHRKQRTFDIALQLLQHRARQEGPLVVIFEDLHWADAISLEMLDYVARNVGRVPILLIGVHRPTLQLDAWSRFPYYYRIDLDDLPAEEALALAKGKLGLERLPTELQSVILRDEQRVNPFYVEEVLNTLIDRGYLLPENGGYVLKGDLSAIEIPGSVQSLVMSRIDRLDESSKLAVRVASVIGRTFKQSTLQAVYPVPVSRDDLHQHLERLSSLDLTLLDNPKPEWEYIFKHRITQEVAYESLLYTHRRDLHRRVAEYLERAYADHPEESYEILAYHYVESGDQDKSYVYLVKAGEKARAQYANEAAVTRLEEALALQVEDTGGWKVHSTLADVYRLMGHYDKALDHYGAALRHPGLSPSQEVELNRRIARTWATQGRYDDAMLQLARIEDTLDFDMDAEALARVYNDMAWIARQRGEYDAALLHCLDGIDQLESCASSDVIRALRSELEQNLGTIYGRMGRYEESITHFQRCISEARARGDLYELASSILNLAVFYWRQGDFDLATSNLEESLDLFRQVGSAQGTAMCHNNLGVLYYTQRKYEKAIEQYQQSLKIRERIGDQQGIADTHTNLGEVYHALKKWNEAMTYLEAAAEKLEVLGVRNWNLIDTYKLLAEVSLALDNVSEALDYAKRSLQFARASNNAEYEAVTTRVIGRIYRHAGALAQSRRYLDRSLRKLEGSANRLELAKTRLEMGLTLRAMDQPRAKEEIQQAAELFEALELSAEYEQVMSILREMQA